MVGDEVRARRPLAGSQSMADTTKEQQQDPDEENRKAVEKDEGTLTEWAKRWSLSILVLAAAIGAVYVACKVSVPGRPPSIALKSPSVYRIEIGVASFVGLYLVAMALVLALHNRAFTEIGMNGLKAQEVANEQQQEAIRGQEDQFDAVWDAVDGMGDEVVRSLDELKGELKDAKTRLVELETGK